MTTRLYEYKEEIGHKEKEDNNDMKEDSSDEKKITTIRHESDVEPFSLIRKTFLLFFRKSIGIQYFHQNTTAQRWNYFQTLQQIYFLITKNTFLLLLTQTF